MDFITHLQEYGFYLSDVGSKQFSTMPEITRFDALILCHSGEAEVEVNMDRIMLSSHCCLVCNRVVYGKTLSVSPDFSATVLIVDSAFSLDATAGVPTEVSNAMLALRVYHIDDDQDWALLNGIVNVMRLYNARKLSVHFKEIVGLQVRSLVMVLSEINKMDNNIEQKVDFTMSDTYFRNFLKLIDAHVKEHHEVAFYAKQLNITPKYLSEVCKNKAGYKAKEVLSAVLVANLKKDIIMSGKSMKVIAYEYGFADQSSLGKFFRKMTGKSPVSYRKGRF
jgi:AraC-like DNA-binding protein